jgi:glycosyltransferase involved in cell wall biosynthesis
MAPEVTVLMPVHNAAAFVRDAAASILSQTFRDFELLVVDDASTDATVTVLESLGDPRIRVIRSRERLRFSGALNAGLDQARGVFVARMDGDDIALPDRLARQREYLRAHPEVGLCGGLAARFGTLRGRFFRTPLTHGEIASQMLFDSPFVHPTVMLRRELFDRHGLRYDAVFCPADDYELWSRAVRLFPAANLDRLVLRYRVHGASLTQAQWGDMDANAARVAAREIAALGLEADEETVRFHRNLGRGRCFPIVQRRVLERAEAWLAALVAANDRTHRNPGREFRRRVAAVWYSACYHAGALGGGMLARYARSALRQAAPTSAKEWAALLHVAVRRTSPTS